MTAEVPDGYTARGAGTDDLAAVAALVTSAEIADLGEPLLTLDDLADGWRRPGFDPAQDAVVVFHRAELVGWAEVWQSRASAAVEPGVRGNGIGTALLEWTELRAGQQAGGGPSRVGQTVSDTNDGAVSLLTGKGYTSRHTSWVLRLPPEASIRPPPLPPGLAIRPFRPDTEERAVYQVIEDAFNEWPNRGPETFAQWRATSTLRNSFDPELLFVAVRESKDGPEVVGAAFGIEYPDEGWVDQLAVRRDQRSLGLGRALLDAVFSELRRRGMSRMGLSTDSRTGALDLYVSIGMEVTISFTHYAKDLGAQTRSR